MYRKIIKFFYINYLTKGGHHIVTFPCPKARLLRHFTLTRRYLSEFPHTKARRTQRNGRILIIPRFLRVGSFGT